MLTRKSTIISMKLLVAVTSEKVDTSLDTKIKNNVLMAFIGVGVFSNPSFSARIDLVFSGFAEYKVFFYAFLSAYQTTDFLICR